MKSSVPNKEVPNYKLIAACFAFPLVSLLATVFLQNTVGETMGGWGLVLCLLASPFALVLLFFKWPCPVKHALRSFLVGFFVAAALYVVGAALLLRVANSP